ncbi:MAG TPA: PLP-dependent aminotransferase family protein [Deltaproteobacteria bacterium]|nr:PLP-dependent aminotransferase family protein [Deltaproteobacteria bacterium]HPP80773.1 PLP-dependent aminotransferase family protein [Deltaproteobacteria bacterium]
MKHVELALKLAEEISGLEGTGARLPTVREVARREGVSLVTAQRAYRHLSDLGIVVSRRGSGTFAAEPIGRGPIDLCGIRVGEEQLRWVLPYLRGDLDGLCTYDPPEGYGPLRESAGAWLARMGVRGDPIVTSGSQQAIFLVGMACLKQGDVVVVEEPGYQGAARIFRSLGASVRAVPYLAHPRDVDALAALEPRLFYTMPQGHIPTGATMPAEVRLRLLERAAGSGFLVVEDDPFSDILGVSPLKSMDEQEVVVHLRSLSNILGPGLRMGITVAPRAMRDRLVQLKEINDLSISGVLQRILCAIFSSDAFAGHLRALAKELPLRRDTARDILGQATQGACLWLHTPVPARLFAEQLEARGVRVTPGDIYGPGWTQHVRISLLGPRPEELKRGLEIVRDHLGRARQPGLTEF